MREPHAKGDASAKGVASRSRVLSRQAKIHLKVAYYYCLFFPITACATRVLSKPGKISNAYKTPASETKRPNNMRTSIPYYFWVSQEVFCSKRFRYLGSENVSKTCFYYCWVFGSRMWQIKEINFRTSVSSCHMRRMQNWNCVFDFNFAFRSLFSFFFCPVSFSRYSLGFTKVEIVVAKVFRNAKLFWRGEGELVQQDFNWNFQVNFTCFFYVFLRPLKPNRALTPAQVRCQSWRLKLMTSQDWG